MQLPTELVPALTENPKLLFLYSKPKVGKTELLAQLPNSLLIDLEDGSDFVLAMKMKAHSTEEIGDILRLVRRAKDPVKYRYGILDTVTALEEMCMPLAEKIYAATSQGQNWFKPDPNDPSKLAPDSGKAKYGTITDIPEGYGYRWLREAYFQVVEAMRKTFPVVILVGHVKDVILEKNGSNVNSVDLDLTGKIKRMSTSKADAIGYMYRKGNQNIISFKTNDEISCGARPPHLSNQELIISEKDKSTNALTTHWDRIFVGEVAPAPSDAADDSE